jgi:hypothetical protein
MRGVYRGITLLNVSLIIQVSRLSVEVFTSCAEPDDGFLKSRNM